MFSELIKDAREIGWFFRQCFGIILAYLVFILMLCGIVFLVSWYEEAKLQKTYPVWIKQTGNPKELTYEEWKLLR